MTRFSASAIHASRRTRSAYTLVEVLLSMTAASMLIVGMASAVFLAARASDPGAAACLTLEAAATLDEIAAELRMAVSFADHGPTSVEFTVADRDGGGSPETIRYAWSGTPGDPLTRQYNGGDAVEVLHDVHSFQLTYHPAPESSEQILAGWDGNTAISDEPISNDKWRGQHFEPSLPADATGWRVTRAKIKVKKEGAANGEASIQLRPAAADGTPTETVLEEVALLESLLTDSFQWKEFSYHDVSGLPAGDGLCLVVKHVSDAHSCRIEYEGGDVTLPDSGLLASSNQGDSWTIAPDKALQFYIYGTYSPGPPNRVALALQAGDNAASEVTTSVEVLNVAEVSPP